MCLRRGYGCKIARLYVKLAQVSCNYMENYVNLQVNNIEGETIMKERIKHIAGGLGYVLIFLGSSVIFTFILMIILAFVIGIQIGISGTVMTEVMIAEQLTQKLLEYSNVANALAQSLTIFLLYMIFKNPKTGNTLQKEANIVPFRKKSIVPIVIMAFTLSIFVSYVLAFVPEEIMQEYLEASASLTEGPLALQLLSTVILAPIMEEILFRGIVLPRFAKAMPLPIAVIASSLVFGIMHGQLIWIAYATFLGLIMSVIALREKSIKASILFHMVFNFFGLFVGAFEFEKMTLIAICVPSFVIAVLSMWLIMKKDEEQVEDTEQMQA